MIEIRDLTFSYSGKKIFERYSLDIPDGVSCITGCSGCGKTTLLRIIAGLSPPQEGTITGVPDRVAYLFQEDRLLPWFSVRENVAAVIPRDNKDSAIEYLRAVELAELADSLPDNLSGGQKRRVSLARALAFRGGLLLLDEPFKGFDRKLMERIVPKIMEQNVPVIAATHSQEEMELLGGTVISL